MDIITVASGALIANGLTFGLIWQLRKLDQQEPNHKAGDLVILIAIGGIIALIGIVAQRTYTAQKQSQTHSAPFADPAPQQG